MKLIIQIPCYNEESTLPLVFEQIPKSIAGIDTIEYQIIDDCSTDNTVEVAKALGVHHVVRIKGENKRWLGRAFKLGIENALKNGADIVVNTDGDNQYPSDEIGNLIKPILEGTADIVIGDRDPSRNQEFSLLKRFLQKLGSATVALVTHEPVKDAVSGFRAYSRNALLELNLITNYTYTVDSLVQALKSGLVICWLPITPNKKTRESRLIKNLFTKVRKSGFTIVRMVTIYRPLKIFAGIGFLFFVPGFFLLLRYCYFFFLVPGGHAGHLQSLLAGGILLIMAFILLLLGVLGDIISVNRVMLDEALTRLRRIELEMCREERND